MKKILICLLVLLMVFLCACSESEEVQSSTNTEKVEDQVVTEINRTEDSEKTEDATSVSKEYEVKYLVEESAENIVTIEIPSFASKETNEIINGFIEDYLETLGLPEFSTSYSENDIEAVTLEYSGYYVDINCKVTEANDDLVGIAFEGFLNNKTSAHPINLFTAMNIDLATGQRVFFKDKYDLNNETYNVFADYAKKSMEHTLGADFADIIETFGESICSEESFINGMTSETEFHAYFTKDSVVISYPVVHAMGDYMVVEIPANEI